MVTQDPMVQLAETTALLSLLKETPEKPKLNTPNINHLSQGPSRQLTFDQEREICASLAFLAGISDDSKHVMAVAVEEAPDPKRILVKLSINKSKSADGDEILEEVEKGFCRIFHVLSQVEHVDPRTSIDRVFREVVSLCRQRILTRLRSRKAVTTGQRSNRPKLLSLFRSVVSFVKSTPNLLTGAGFATEASRLLHTLEAFEDIGPGPEEEKLLRKLIKEIRRFLQGGDLERVLKQIRMTKVHLDPSIGGAVVDEFSKLAHYRTVSRTLYEKSQTLEIFRSIKVEKIRPRSGMFYKPPTTITPDLAAVLAGYQVDDAAQKTLTEIYQKRSKTNSYPATSFTRTVKRTLTSGRIHAEVQILSYYEDSNLTRRPRVIVSTKDACFLCNALFSLYNCYHLPKSHGQLYTGWLLPTNLLSTSHQLTKRLNKLIRNYNTNAINQLLSKKRGERHPHPNESTILFKPLSVSSLADSMLSVVQPSRSSAKASSATTISQNNSVNAGQSTRPDINMVDEDWTPASLKSEPSEIESSSSFTSETSKSSEVAPELCGEEIKGQPTQTTSVRLSRGKIYSVLLHPDKESTHIYTDFLELFIQCPGKGKSVSGTPDVMVIEVEWLSTSGTSDLDPATHHDAHSLSTETETTCRSNGEVLLRVGDQFVRLNRR